MKFRCKQDFYNGTSKIFFKADVYYKCEYVLNHEKCGKVYIFHHYDSDMYEIFHFMEFGGDRLFAEYFYTLEEDRQRKISTIV